MQALWLRWDLSNHQTRQSRLVRAGALHSKNRQTRLRKGGTRQYKRDRTSRLEGEAAGVQDLKSSVASQGSPPVRRVQRQLLLRRPKRTSEKGRWQHAGALGNVSNRD